MKVVADTLRCAPEEDMPLLAWPFVCGSAVAERTRALSFADGELLVETPNAAWRTQLLALSGDYLRNLKQLTGGKVQRLRFVLPGEMDSK